MGQTPIALEVVVTGRGVSALLVGRTGGTAAAEVEVERGGQKPPVPQARSLGQQPPPREGAQVL